MNRFDHLHKTYREARVRARKEAILAKSRPEVGINAGGANAYRVQNGVNAGRDLKHISTHKDNI